ncbi:molybdenum cofactor guanylyltransferase MobA [Methylomonas methanica]|uniref:Molybdenum cofactor guanylyltransferase n=1 Tax=Methylomonas methanica (strain DSM 25384 / MC09) TaxID=857087 RepID=G0A2J1_METMM|nr:molybdenum cofactor guanylyltransferase MobA [Methylomonas methanica]AEG00171.1 Molybdopterin-guanine dinucleotide biosynthesis protein A [Methylomonas methanica MC09]
MGGQNKVSGVVLAGGMARRMQQQDKGLVMFNRRPLISYALAAMQPVTDELFISANRNRGRYELFGFPVISDSNANFEGPLAGILAAMQAARYSVLLVMPCDSPFFTGRHLQQLLDGLGESNDIAVAFDGERLHPVFVALKTHLQTDLQAYLQHGERKLQTWLLRHHTIKVDLSRATDIFTNINTPTDLQTLENNVGNGPESV